VEVVKMGWQAAADLLEAIFQLQILSLGHTQTGLCVNQLNRRSQAHRRTLTLAVNRHDNRNKKRVQSSLVRDKTALTDSNNSSFLLAKWKQQFANASCGCCFKPPNFPLPLP